MKGRARSFPLLDFLQRPFTGLGSPTLDTSSSAADAGSAAVDDARETDRARIMRMLRRAPWVDTGATDDDIQSTLGLSGNSERPRRVELVRAGLVDHRDGQTRATANGRKAVLWWAK